MRRACIAIGFSGAITIALCGAAFAQESGTTTPPTDSVVSVGSAPPTTAGESVTPTLPPSCTPPPAPDVVFIGRIIDAAGGVGRFVVTAIRSDPKQMLAVGRPVDVRIGADLRFLVYNENYLVAAEHTPDNALRSKVRQPLPVFGGDQVVGIDDFGPQCPALSDPIVLRNANGSAIDTGVLSGFLDDRRGIARSILVPVLAVLGGLVAIWALKRLVVYATRGLGEMFGQR